MPRRPLVAHLVTDGRRRARWARSSAPSSAASSRCSATRPCRPRCRWCSAARSATSSGARRRPRVRSSASGRPGPPGAALAAPSSWSCSSAGRACSGALSGVLVAIAWRWSPCCSQRWPGSTSGRHDQARPSTAANAATERAVGTKVKAPPAAVTDRPDRRSGSAMAPGEEESDPPTRLRSATAPASSTAPRRPRPRPAGARPTGGARRR